MLFFLVLVHCILCLTAFLLMKSGILKSSSAVMPIVFFIPVFGFLCLFVLEWESRGDQESKREVGIEKLKINDEIHRSILMEEEPARDLIVPLQEALLINDASTRRQLIMDILYHDTGEYVDVLNKARMNDDVEVVHYATTAMVELQKDYEEQLKTERAAWEEEKDSPALSGVYLRTLEAYINSGLLEGNMKRSRQQELDELLEYKIRHDDNTEEEELSLYRRRFDNSLSLEEYTAADTCAEHVLNKWPQMEEGYLMNIRLGIQRRERERIGRMLGLIEDRKIYLSPDARKTVEFWKDDNGRQKTEQATE